MQIILLKDVPKVGRQFEVKNVADGHALNLLFPRGLAELATKEKVAVLESRRAEIAHLQEASASALAAAFKKLDGTTVPLNGGKASEQGNLYKGIGPEGVAEALSKAAGVKITTNNFELSEHIKAAGKYPIELSAGGVTSRITLLIEAA